jgi:hypothetical protein
MQTYPLMDFPQVPLRPNYHLRIIGKTAFFEEENKIQDKKYHLKQLYGKFGKVVGIRYDLKFYHEFEPQKLSNIFLSIFFFNVMIYANALGYQGSFVIISNNFNIPIIIFFILCLDQYVVVIVLVQCTGISCQQNYI